MDQEEKKIIGSKHLTFVDKCDAVKSVRSVSRTIEGLIDKEKEKLTEFYMHEGSRQQSPFAEGSRRQYQAALQNFGAKDTVHQQYREEETSTVYSPNSLQY